MVWLFAMMACTPGGATLTGPGSGGGGAVTTPTGGGGGGGGATGSTGATGNTGTATGGTGTGTGTGNTTPQPVPVTAAWAVDGFDPLGAGEAEWSVTSDPGVAVTVRLLDGEQVVWEQSETTDGSGLLTGAWDGRAGGEWAGTGWFSLQVEVDGSGESAAADVAVVRPGFVEVYAEDDEGLTSTRVPLYYPGDGALQDPAYPLAALDAIDDGATAAPFPPVDDEMEAGTAITDAQPMAYSADSRPLLTLVVANDFHTALGETGLDDVDVSVEVDGWTVVEGNPLAPGGHVVLMADEPLGDTVGVTEDSLDLRFVVGSTEVSSQAMPVRFYRVLGPATFGWEERKYNPWTAGIDPALRGIDGTPAEHDAVVDALVEWVYGDLGLVYDTERGASFYSEYGGGWDHAWDEPHFYFSDFLRRANGTVVNCTDSGNILTTYSNMVGAELHHLIILENFDLNEIKAIGIDDYTSCPFGPRGCGFSYHAVTTDDAGGTIWDATLALDGDLDPGEAPYDVLPVQTIDGEEYLMRLVRDGDAAYYYESRGTIQ